MSHYFQDDPNLASNIKTISFEVNGITMNLLTDNGVFSKNKVDEGAGGSVSGSVCRILVLSNGSVVQLPGKDLLFLWGELRLIGGEALRVLFRNKVPLRGTVHPGDVVQVAGDQLPAQEEGGIRPLRQVMVADAELPGIGKAAFAVEQERPDSQRFSCLTPTCCCTTGAPFSSSRRTTW